jgi:hypothetical protein
MPILNPDQMGSRVLEVSGKRLNLPAYVPSFSELHLGEPLVGRIWRHFLEALRDAALPAIMVSIFDLLYGPRMSLLTKKASESAKPILDVFGLARDTVLFLDSGGLEWSEHPSQEFSAERSYAAGRVFGGDIITLLDYPSKRREPPSRSNEYEVASTFSRIHNELGALAAVAHGSSLQELIEAVSQLSGLKGIDVVCVTSKETGPNLDARTQAIPPIRRAAGDKVLHILAEGSPHAWSRLAPVGVDSFDATSWSRGLFVPNTFRRLDDWNPPAAECLCSHCNGEPMNRTCRTMKACFLHNWALFNFEMNTIRDRIRASRA